MTRYQHLATLLAERIEQGLYRHGEKLPSVRSLSQEHGVIISTVQQAYQIMETLTLITPQPRSGEFVAQRKAQPPVPPMTRPVQRPVEITQWDQVLDMLEAHSDNSIVPSRGEIAVGAQLKSGARRQHQYRAAGVSDTGDDEAHHSAAAFGLFCRTT